MSILSTESFVAFGSVNSNDDSYTTDNTALRNAHAANLRRAGYQVVIGTQATALVSGGLVVRPDPVSPDRNALFFSSGGANPNVAQAAIRKPLPLAAADEAIIGGFSLFVPADYVKANGAVTNAGSIFRVIASGMSDDTWSEVVTTVAATVARHESREVFRVTQDLLFRRGNVNAAQSTRALVPGKVNFIEYRISAEEVRVWLDDVLVLQAPVSLNTETIGFSFDQTTVQSGASALTGAAGRWAIGNWYNLLEDTQAPNVRLGPTTRIAGVRAAADIEVDFLRPNGYASNASVIAQNLVENPPATLQSLAVGDQDVYAPQPDPTTANSAMIHAVVTKVLASNLEASPHTIRPLVIGAEGNEADIVKSREWQLMPSFSTRNLQAVARRPTDGKIFAVGSGNSVYVNDQDGAPLAWRQVQDDGSATVNRDIIFRPDGWGVIARAGGLEGIAVIPPNAEAPITVLSGATYANSVQAIVARGVFLVSVGTQRVLRCPAGLDPSLPASWSLVVSISAARGQYGIAYLPDFGANGRVFVHGTVTSGNNNWGYSDDLGATWTGPLSNIAASAAMSSDGKQIIRSSSNIAIARSTDATTWVAPTGVMNTNGTVGAATTSHAVDLATNETIILGVSGAMTISKDSNNWRPITRVQTAQAYRGGCKNANGDWIIVGDAGVHVMHRVAPADAPLVPLAGYQPTFSASTVNPDTGLLWTPSEAAVANFGMRVTS